MCKKTRRCHKKRLKYRFLSGRLTICTAQRGGIEITEYLEDIINKVKEELPTNIFIDYILSFKEDTFGVNEKPEFFKSQNFGGAPRCKQAGHARRRRWLIEINEL